MFNSKFQQYFSLLAIATLIQSTALLAFLSDISAQGNFEPPRDAPAPKTTKGGTGRGLFEPPKGEPAPKQTIGGGRRNSDGQCQKDRTIQPSERIARESLEQKLIPLIPTNKLGLTVSPTPTFFAYVPKTSAIAVEFTIENPQGKGIAQKRVKLTNSPSIVYVQFEKTSLEVGKDYKWLVSVVCESGDPEDTYSEGIIRRIQPNPALTKQLDKASAIDKVYLYGKFGIWHEAMANLAQLRLAQPNNTELKTIWIDLLKSSNLESLANAPLKK